MPAAIFNSSLGKNRDDVGDSLKLHVRFQHHHRLPSQLTILPTYQQPQNDSPISPSTQFTMRPTLRLLATPTRITRGTKPEPMALLPPILLYRRLLRAHRKHLPAEMRVLGDQYVKSEFRAHQKIDNPVHIVGFLTEWQSYTQMIEGDAWKGEKMDRAKVEKMSDEQVAQMYELMQTIREAEVEDNEAEVEARRAAEDGDKKN